ncbi:MAG: polyprenyl synthetase family protein [Verrucomicrobiota bacterium]
MPVSAPTKSQTDAKSLGRHRSSNGPLEILLPLEEELHACITMEVKELEDRITEHPTLKPAWQVLKAFLRRPGKRVRPSLFLLSYSMFDGRKAPPPRAAFRVAGALEIFHAFALVHDDLIDCSDSRRGKPTLHRGLEANVTSCARNAESLALVLGDILFGFAMECFLDPDLPGPPSQTAMRYFLRIAQETGIGQAAEISMLDQTLGDVREADILRTYHLKTTRYTVECPLVLGAILAGGSHEAQSDLKSFASPLGLAFQMENDLHEVELLPDVAPELAYDFRCGVKTLAIKRLHDALPTKKRQILVESLKVADTPEGVTRLAKLVEDSGIIKELRQEIRQHFMEARKTLQESSLPQAQVAFLESVVSFIQKNRHHSESVEVPSAQSA